MENSPAVAEKAPEAPKESSPVSVPPSADAVFEEEYKRQMSEKPVTLTDSPSLMDLDEIHSPHLYYFSQLARISQIKASHSITFPQLEPVTYQDIPTAYVNEFNLPESDTSRSQNYIHVPFIGAAIRYISNSDKNPALSFRPVGSLYKSLFGPDSAQSVPKPLPEEAGISIRFEVGQILLDGQPSDGITAIFYIADFANGSVLTQMAVVKTTKGVSSFLIPELHSVIFNIPKASDSLRLVCHLLHDQAGVNNEFISYIRDNSKTHMPLQSPFHFAVQAAPIFSQSGLLQSIVFPDSFYLTYGDMTLGDIGTLPKSLANRPNQQLKVTVPVKLSIVDCLPRQITYLWPSPLSDNLLLPCISHPTSPLITITNIMFTFKNAPKGKYVYFDAFLAETPSNLKNPTGTPAAITFRSFKPIDRYTSSVIPASSNSNFPDIMTFIIDHPLPKTAHIVIQFNIITPGKPTINYKVSVLPLFENDGFIEGKTMEIPLFEYKNVTNSDYLPLKKLNPQSRTHLAIGLPPVFCPASCFIPIVSAKSAADLVSIKTADIPPNRLISYLIPTVARFIQFLAVSSIEYLIEFISSFKPEDITPILKSWAYNVFDPTIFPKNFAIDLMKTHSSYIHKILATPEDYPRVLLLLNIHKTLPFFFDILTVSIVSSQSNLLPEFSAAFLTFCTRVSDLISLLSMLQIDDLINKAYSQFIFRTSLFIPEDAFISSVTYHLLMLAPSNHHDLNLDPNPLPDQKQKRIHPPTVVIPSNNQLISLRLSFLQTFASNRALILATSSKNSIGESPFSIFVQILEECFVLADPNLIRRSIVLYSGFVRPIESFPSIVTKCTKLLLPYLPFSMKFINSQILSTDYQIFIHFLIPILVIIHNTETSAILSKLQRPDFVTFLEKLITMVLSPSESKETLGTLKGVKSKIEESKSLKALRSLTSSINYLIFHELSQRTLEFIDILLKSDFSDSIAQLTSLFTTLLNRHQCPDSIKDVILLVSRMVDECSQHFFFSHNIELPSIIHTSLKLVYRQMRNARAAGTALLIHMFYLDYSNTGTIIATSHYFFDQLISTIIEVPEYKIQLIPTLLERMKLFIGSFRIESFVAQCTERLAAAKVVYESSIKLRGPNVSPEKIAEESLKISSQFFAYPILRLKWLRKAVESQKENASSAFVGQMKISALIAKVIGQKLDFSFIPSCEEENKAYLSTNDKRLLPLLINEPSLSLKGLTESLEKAVSFGSSLLWLSRFCFFRLQQIREEEREFLSIAPLVGSLAETYDSLETKYNYPVKFFLVLKRRNSIDSERMIYSTHLANFAEFLNRIEFGRYEYGETATMFEKYSELEKVINGVCAMEVKPTKKGVSVDCYDEFFHEDLESCGNWNSIRMKRIVIKTEEELPNLKSISKVKDLKEEGLTRIKALKERAEIAQNDCESEAKSLSQSFVPSDLEDEWKLVKPALNLRWLDAAIGMALGDDLVTELKEGLSSESKEEALAIGKCLYGKILGSLSVLKEAAAEAAGKASYTPETDKIEEKVKSLGSVIGAVWSEVEATARRVDPMKYSKSYEYF